MSHRTLPDRRRLGGIAEAVAVSFLKARGLEIVGRNVTVGGGVTVGTGVTVGPGELDLVVVDGGVRVAVEVRSITGTGAAVDAFDDRKANQVWKLARAMRPPCSRVDLVAVRFGGRFLDVHWIPSIS